MAHGTSVIAARCWRLPLSCGYSRRCGFRTGASAICGRSARSAPAVAARGACVGPVVAVEAGEAADVVNLDVRPRFADLAAVCGTGTRGQVEVPSLRTGWAVTEVHVARPGVSRSPCDRCTIYLRIWATG